MVLNVLIDTLDEYKRCSLKESYEKRVLSVNIPIFVFLLTICTMLEPLSSTTMVLQKLSSKSIDS